MNCDGKKISFGFSKISKKPNVFTPPTENKNVELIDCLEGTEIKVKNAIEKVQKAPLVIPIKGDANNIVSQIERGILKNKIIKTETNNEDSRPDSELTIEELAARQLIKEARNRLLQSKDTTKVHTLPLEDSLAVEDGAEPSIDDYENVPIEDFGLACLRGMGWKEGMSIGKNPSKLAKFAEPNLRPKGLGLGAQKILDIQSKDVFDQNGKKLVLAKGAFAKIVVGLHKGKCCEVQFCDEWSGRVTVKISNTDEILTLNELFVVPISREEYIRESKVINKAKYEQYKMKEENIQVSYSNSTAEVKVEHVKSEDDYSQNTRQYLQHKKTKHVDGTKYKTRGRSRDKSRRHKSSRSTDSSESCDENEYEKTKQPSKGKQSSEINSTDSSESTSGEDFNRKSERKHRSRSKSSLGCNRNNVEQNQKNKSHKHQKNHKGKRREERSSSRNSSDDYRDRNISYKYSKNKSKGKDYHYDEKCKNKKEKIRKKRRDASSDSDYSTQNSRSHGSKSKSHNRSRH